MQTSYSNNMAIARAGMIADNGPRHVVSKVNPVVAIPFGLAVCAGVDPDRDVKLPTSAAEAAASLGVAVASTSVESQAGSDDPNWKIGSDVSVIRQGRVWVKVLEDVTAGNDVYVRYADGIIDTNDDQKGAFGDAQDGTAQVNTITPTPVNSTVYDLWLNDFHYTYTSDGSATDAEIVTAFKDLINASSIPVTASGTTTLILTADVAGTGFTVTVGANLANVATTANAAASAKVNGWKYATSASAGGFAIVELNSPA